MARISTNRIAWQYHAEDGTIYRVAAVAGYTSQARLGGEAWAGTAPPKPSNIKMRRITVRSTAHGSRVVPVYSSGAPICTAGSAINLNADTDSFSFESDGNTIPETHLRKNVTRQST